MNARTIAYENRAALSMRLEFISATGARLALARIETAWRRMGVKCDAALAPSLDKTKKNNRTVWVLVVTASRLDGATDNDGSPCRVSVKASAWCRDFVLAMNMPATRVI